ncbi:hypothetical protein PGIGA_G00178360, partial [Pangasianodon gigas]|nr:hypothetical protein [Pangasianodon gigas]
LGRFTGEREVGHQSFFTTIPGNSLLWSRWIPFASQRMIVLFFLLCSQLLLVGGVMIPVMEKNITLSCKNISAGDGYTYRVSPDIPSALLHDKDCEQAWYNETGEFVSDGQLHANQSKHHLVVDANRENITVSECIKLQHQVTCHGSSKEWKHFYQVNNDTSSPAPITAQQCEY